MQVYSKEEVKIQTSFLKTSGKDQKKRNNYQKSIGLTKR